MRHILAFLPLIALLGGCGRSDEEVREARREEAQRSCLEGVQGATPPPGVAWDALCSCVTRRITEGKTAEQLEMPPSDTERRNAVRQCITEARAAPAG